MPDPDPQEGAAVVSVEERQVSRTVERLKATLPDEVLECGVCGYAGEAFRWGLKTYPAKTPRHVALALCCPSCERPPDPSDLDEAVGDGV
ncbi:MAG TPA: hypothetical protein VKA37_02675 [Halobacteriales archaeon]|nr:hypothetical protein [Halobacteriales archaeon]